MEIEKDIENNATEILKDILQDNKIVTQRLQTTIILLIILLAGVVMFFEYNFKSFLKSFDFRTEANIETTNDAINTGNINVNK